MSAEGDQEPIDTVAARLGNIDRTIAEAAIIELVKRGEEGANAAIGVLKNPKNSEQAFHDAQTTLYDLREAAIRPLIGVLEEGKSVNACTYAANVLGNSIYGICFKKEMIKGKETWVATEFFPLVTNALIISLGNQTKEIADAAMFELSMDSVFEPYVLIALKEDIRPQVRAHSAEILADIGTRASVEPLRDALNDLMPEVRLAAIHTLTSEERDTFGQGVLPKAKPSQITSILSVLGDLAERDLDPRVRKAAEEAIPYIRATCKNVLLFAR